MGLWKLLVGSPVRQKHTVLSEFLKGLDEADKDNFDVTYFFVDDNTDQESKDLLAAFSQTHDTVIAKGEDLVKTEGFDSYVCDDVTHLWDPSIIRKVAFFKDTIIEYAIMNKFDYLFFVDSDIVVDRRTLSHLASRNVEIISNVFWTQWQPNWMLEPQCFWMPDIARQEKAPFAGTLSLEEARQRRKDFFAKMMVPGIYKVDGLGACTLIKVSALEKGARFKEIPNLSLMGEDRHFCIRAGALGIDLYFDTVYPVYHIYREEYLDRVDEFKRDGFKYDMCQTFAKTPASPKQKEDKVKKLLDKGKRYLERKREARKPASEKKYIVYNKSIPNSSVCLQIIVDNRTLSYFEKTIASTAGIASYAVVISYTNDKRIKEVCDRYFDSSSYCVVFRDSIDPSGDELMRSILWEKADPYNPGWILSLNSGEVLPEAANNAIFGLLRHKSFDLYRFRKYYMWNEDEYRADGEWDPNKHTYAYLARYKAGHHYHWNNNKYSKFPIEMAGLTYANIDLKIKDYTFAEESNRSRLSDGYLQLSENQKKTINDPQPVLKNYSSLPQEL